MNKKLISAVISLSLISPVAVAQASSNTTPVLAILDTAIDTSLPQFKDKIVEEVCILQWALCPNGTTFQVGPGSASMPSDLIVKGGFDHGTQMTDVAIKNNPNMKILFIKIIANTSTGLRKPTGETTISAALFWVMENAEKYNIKAVSLSQGSSGLLGASGTDYCPVFPRTVTAVTNLLEKNIPVFSASGNNRDYSRIDWPSCVDQVVSVGAVDQINEIASYTNMDSSKLDFFSLGIMQASGPGNIVKNIAGTSAATQVAAAQYLKAVEQTGNSGQILIDKLKSTALTAKGRQGTFQKLLNISNNVSFDKAPVDKTAEAAAKSAAEAAAKSAAEAAAKSAAEAAAKAAASAKAAIQAQAKLEIAAAEAQYLIDLKSAQDKLAATKALWMAKLNG
jgi:hypothetical protein